MKKLHQGRPKKGREFQLSLPLLKNEEYLQAIAELAGAMAHEIFQPLTAISLNAELIQGRMAAADPGRKYIAAILDDIRRITELVERLKQISRYETKPYLGEDKILDIEKSAPLRFLPEKLPNEDFSCQVIGCFFKG